MAKVYSKEYFNKKKRREKYESWNYIGAKNSIDAFNYEIKSPRQPVGAF